MSCRSSSCAEPRSMTSGAQLPRRGFGSARLPALLAAILVCAGGCSQVRGRKQVQEANELYKKGRYTEAVAAYTQAEALVPDLPTLWLNKGYTCRQLIAPGGRDPASKEAAACALSAFRRLGEVAPEDPRAEQLVVQTWFDTDDFAALEAHFLARTRAASERRRARARAAGGLLQMGPLARRRSRGRSARRRCARRMPSPSTRSARSSGRCCPATAAGRTWRPTILGRILRLTAARCWFPRLPRLRRPAVTSAPPCGSSWPTRGWPTSNARLALRPKYPEAMTYLGLVWRQKSFAYFADPIAWQAQVDEADAWQKRALTARPGKS